MVDLGMYIFKGLNIGNLTPVKSFMGVYAEKLNWNKSVLLLKYYLHFWTIIWKFRLKQSVEKQMQKFVRNATYQIT